MGEGQEMALDAITEDIRLAALEVAGDWPDVFTTEELQADLSLQLLDSEKALELAATSEDRRVKYLRDLAKDTVSRELAELSHYSGREVYSVSQVRNLLSQGWLTNGRTTISHQGPDLDMGCRLLAMKRRDLAVSIAKRYVKGESEPDPLLNKAVTMLTHAMNTIATTQKALKGVVNV